jgi:hypothetical protein
MKNVTKSPTRIDIEARSFHDLACVVIQRFPFLLSLAFSRIGGKECTDC